MFVRTYFDVMKRNHGAVSTESQKKSCLLSVRVSNDAGDSLPD